MRPKRYCQLEDCDLPFYADGYCQKHCMRWRRHGDPYAGRTAVGEPLRFLEAHLRTESDECVIWPFALNINGYPKLQFGKDTGTAHRHVCELTHGNAPAPDLHAAHSCGVRACINPRHLRWATVAENTEDRRLHGNHVVGMRNAHSKLTDAEVLQIRDLFGHIRTSDIANAYGIHRSTVLKIFKRMAWSSVA